MRSSSGNVRGKRVEQRGLAGTGSAADQDVQAGFHAGLQQFQHAFGQGQLGHQVLAFQGVPAETADGEQRTVHGDRRDGGVDARAVGQAGVHQRRRFVHAAAHARNHFFNDAQQVRVVFELHRRAVQFAAALHVDQLRRGDQDVADGGILQQRLERAQAEDFIQNLFDDAVFFHQAERRLLFFHQLGDGGADFRADALAGHGGEGLQVDPVQQLAVQRELQLLVFRGVPSLGEKAVHPAGFPAFTWSRRSYPVSWHVVSILSAEQRKSLLAPVFLLPGWPASSPAWRSACRAPNCG